MSEVPVMLPALPEMVLAVAIMGQMMLGAYSSRSSALSLVTPASIATLVVVAFLVIKTGTETQLAFNGLFKVDAFAHMMKLMVLVASIAAIVMSRSFIAREGMAKFEYPILISFATLGMMMMISANDLMSLYIGLELQSLSLYVIAAFRRDNLRSTEAGLKYFILGAVASGLLLYGCSLVYGFTGTTSFDVLADTLAQGDVHVATVIGLVFIVTAMAFKISAVPFHMWTPDVYEGAPTPVTAFFAVAPKVAAIALFLRVMVGPFGELLSDWQQVVAMISAASMILGAVAAVAQTNIKRLMAYSSIGHMGFALIGLSAGSEQGVQAVIVYMVIYLIMNIGTFGCILSMKVKGQMVENISDLAGLAKTNTPMAFALLIFMFSMAGIPPFAGFWSKYYVFVSGVDAGLTWLVIIGAVSSVVSAYYYLRIIKVCFFDDEAESFDPQESKSIKSVIALTAFVTTVLFVVLPLVTEPASQAAASLFAG